MQQVSIKSMLEAGVHFGHQTRRWNPKMSSYIYGSRNNIHIIDLQKSAKELKKALRFAEGLTLKGGSFLFVGTKRQAQETVRTEAQRCGSFYLSNRWVGGMLTNFGTIKKSIDRLREMEKMLTEGILDVLNKKEGRKFQRELESLKLKYEGVKTMSKLPNAVFIVDPTEEMAATLEARRMRVPIIAICDTNADPDLINYPIPGNDDALRSIRFFVEAIAQTIFDVKAKTKPIEEKMVEEGVQANPAPSDNNTGSAETISESVVAVPVEEASQ